MWNKKLGIIANGKNKILTGCTAVNKRASFLLEQRTGRARIPAPAKGKSFFSFEEDLIHHVREAAVVVSTGIPVSFFDNTHVRELLMGLNDRHRPLYRQKLLRLIRCIVDVLQEEVSCFALSTC